MRFSLCLLWNRYLGKRRSGLRDLSTFQNSHKFCSDRLIALKFLQEFLEVVLIMFVEESLLGDEEVQSARHDKRVKGP